MKFIEIDKQFSAFIDMVLPPSSGFSIPRTISLTPLNLLVSSNRKKLLLIFVECKLLLITD